MFFSKSKNKKLALLLNFKKVKIIKCLVECSVSQCINFNHTTLNRLYDDNNSHCLKQSSDSLTRPYDQVTLRQDYQSSFWGRSRHPQNNNSRCLKNLLIDGHLIREYQNRFWGRSRYLNNNNSRCFKQSYEKNKLYYVLITLSIYNNCNFISNPNPILIF